MSLSPDLDAVKAEIRQLIINSSNLKTLTAEEIKDDQLLFDGSLGLDSIDLLELVVALQRKFGIKLRNDDEGQQALRSVGSLAAHIHQYLIAPLAHGPSSGETTPKLMVHAGTDS